MVRKTRNYLTSDTGHTGAGKLCVCVSLYTDYLLMSCQWCMRGGNCVLENIVISVSSIVRYYFPAFEFYLLVR